MKLASLQKDLKFDSEKIVIHVMMETSVSKEIRILFKKGQAMKEHQAGYPITVEVHQGLIHFGVEGQTIKMKAGDLISLNANIPHNLVAKEDSIVRLTLTKLDTVDRVKDVVK